MKHAFKIASLGIAISCVSIVGASASTIDFTAFPVHSPAPVGRTGTILVGADTVTWTLAANLGEAINYNQAYDGPATGPAHDAGLALINDGIGIRDDELTNDVDDGIYETLTLSFSQRVRITGFHFLDLFISSNSGSSDDIEIADVAWSSGTASYDAVELAIENGGYRFGDSMDTGIYTDSLTFTAAATNDSLGYADYSLAAVDVAPVPLPAGGLLLLGALGGLGFARRRKA